MKTKLLLILIIFSVSKIFAQTDTLQVNNLKKSISTLQNKVENLQLANNKIVQETRILKSSIRTLKEKQAKLNNAFENYKQLSVSKMDSLESIVQTNSSNIEKTANELGVKIENTKAETKQSISGLSEKISKNTLYWIIAALLTLLALIFVYLLLKKQIFKQKSDLINDIENTRKTLEEESVKLDLKLADILEKQLNIIKEEREKPSDNNTIDHSLVLKVADKLISMEKNLARMDEKTKGLKQLKRAIKNIKDNFAANGYEIVDMLGKEYDEGMKVIANFIPDENLEQGKQIITRIIKPQVNYKGEMIQSAQIEVSVGE